MPLLLVMALAGWSAGALALDAKQINAARPEGRSLSRAATVKLQILLDRARFSPGVIDGRLGENVENALRAFRDAEGIEAGGADIDAATWKALSRDAPKQAIVEMRLGHDDIKGPFTRQIPNSLEDQRGLERLGYRSAAEKLAETYHMDQDFFDELNAGRELEAGAVILVANVRGDGGIEDTARLEVAKSAKQVRAYAQDGRLLATFPATMGSAARPAPSGELSVEAVAERPTYTVKPSNEITGVDAEEPFEIAPGPNNPVGLIWIELSKESYGIHGTPEPAQIGKTASHGCIRLTNWDARTLARSVERGMPVHFVDEPGSSSN